MKFFWKIFFAFTVLITVVFSIFGMWAISHTFQNSYAKELEEGERENELFQYAFEMNMNSLPASYQREEILIQMAKGIIDNLKQNDYIYTIFDDRGYVLYTSKDPGTEQLANGIMGTLTMEKNCGYEVVASEEAWVLYFMCRSQVGNRTFYLESAKDITDIYEERDEFSDRYRIVMLVLLALSSVIIFILSHLLTKSIVNLSESTRRFAKGNYQIRADESAEDEIGMLSRDFNQMADKLTEKMNELTDAVKRQEDFTASFAHELKTPLTSIIGYSDMLRTMDMSQEETMEAANYIYSQGKRLESLSFKLLELIVLGRQDFPFKDVSVTELTGVVEKIVESALKQRNVELKISVEEGYVFGESDLLESLVVNLIDNARKALPDGGKIQVYGRNSLNTYEMTVSDNGCGMKPEDVKRITEAFYMVDKSRSRKEGGAGLGMTLCNRIVELHGAKWEIQSVPGEGTEIKIFFPKGKRGQESRAEKDKEVLKNGK
ncbi:MAG: HAMP domain-containing histidine kinase [Lachnospiraceae bacterium]|nr:HAMP domain-containing histidine kinase [Lachnospiraceae bacterium]